MTSLPDPLLDHLEGDFGLSFRVARVEGGRLTSLGAAFCAWSLPRVFSGDGFGVSPEAQRAIAEALVGCPRPSAVIDGLTQVCALWLLTEPVNLIREGDRAGTLQRRLAQTLGADMNAADDLSTMLPLPGGIVRNWGADPLPPRVDFAHVDPQLRYRLADLE